MTKIFYISFSYRKFDESLGFNKKDLDKIYAINKLPNTEGRMITFVYGLDKDKWLTPFHLLKKVEIVPSQKYFNSFKVNKAIFNSINTYLEYNEFDIVLMRYQMASRSLYKLSKKLGDKLFFEHNSKELSEFIYRTDERRAKLKFSIKPGYFIYLFEGKILPTWLEKFYGPRIRRQVKSGFSVTHEIGKYQQKIYKHYDVCVVANGVHFEKSSIHMQTPYTGKQLKLFMLLGTRADWHGVNRLLKSLNLYKGEVDIQIDIIGYYMSENKKLSDELNLSNKVRFKEPVLPNELTGVLNGYHIAIGTLGLHRKNLYEASTLKVRESLMRGFPVLLGYKDTDFIEENPVSKYVYEIPSDESIINFEEVVKFADMIYSNKVSSDLIHNEAEKVLSYSVKTKQILEFINLKVKNKNHEH